MEKMVSTYGKTWHTWHTDQNKDLPYGSPMLMMGFIKDGQIDTAMVKKIDATFGVSTDEKRKNREDIPDHLVVPGADAWKEGKVKQLPSLTSSGNH